MSNDMARTKTWDVVVLGITPVGTISLCCPKCGTDAEMPIGDTSQNPVIASVGLSLIFDRPGDAPKDPITPVEVRCRTCRRVFTQNQEEDVKP